jgi:PST family polysaccharide transporter
LVSADLHASGATLPAAAQERFFETPGLSRDLKKRSVRGAAVTVSAQLTRIVLRFGSTAVLARLLTPEDYGLVAMTVVVTGFAGLFKDAGLTAATVQREKIAHDQISTLFWINVALGSLIALCLVAVSPLAAAFFREPRLTAIIGLTGTSFVMAGLTVQHQALLRRQMRFSALAGIEIVSMLAGIATAVAMAYAGFRYWSLVGMTLVIAASNLVAVWIAVRWRPGLPKRGCGVRPMLRFGGDVLTFSVVNYFSRHADNLLIGWYWGAGPLGLYEKAYNLLLLPITQINAPLAAVAIPALSRAWSDPARFKRYFLACLQVVASAGVPIVLVIGLFADELVFLWLGPQWAECAGLFRLLSLAALLSALSNPMGWMLTSAGFTRRYRNIGLATAPLIVAAFAIGLPFGPDGVAVAYSAVMALLMIPAWKAAIQGTTISLREIGFVLLPPVAAGLTAFALTAGFSRALSSATPDLSRAAIGVAGFALAYLLMLLAVFRRWRFFAEIAREVMPGGVKG